ncbi:Protein kinase domain-containing protein [Aphelenchoides fujianensis]|nr:Protein kinase domain-containing protein [Aphelenchoides fujianensis]
MGDLIQLAEGKVIDKKWRVEKKLGEGAFGAVYKCTDEKKNVFALKVEGKDEKIQLLKMEVIVLNKLRDEHLNRHFCKIEDKGQVENFNYVVMTFVGTSLADLRMEAPNKHFSLGTALSVGIQCLEALEDLHSIGYLHRDVKPGNYTMGRREVGEIRKVYVLDFGMVRKFVHEDGTIRNPRQQAGFRGTVKYAPLSSHLNRELCRKDDVESWLYQQSQDEIGVMKKKCRKDRGLKQLFGNCPRQFIDILALVDGCKFFDAPDYAKIYELMRAAIKSTGAKEYPYDFEKPPAPPAAPPVAPAK